MSIKYWFVSLLLCSVFANAQVEQTDRYELPIHNNAYEVTSLEEGGLLLHRQLSSALLQQYEVIKLDTAYQQQWQGFIPIDNNFSVSHTRFFKSQFCLLFKSSNFYDFRFISIDEKTGKYAHYQFRNYIPFIPTEFEVNDNAAIIGGYYNKVPIIIFFDLQTLKLKILPGLFSEIGQLEQIKVYDDNTFDVLLCARYFNREKTIWLKSYSPEGEFINQTVLPAEGNKNLLFGRILRTPENMKIIAGVYGNRNSEYSKGLFVASVDPFGEKQLRYYNFADLENFFAYMKPRQEERVKGRINRRKLKGKNNRFNYRMLVHELIPYQDQFILLGEAFYPKYQTVSRSSSGFFYAPRSSSSYATDQVFDGYRYTHATVLGFDSNGRLLWDNSFEINDVKTFHKEQFVKLKAHNTNITLLYLYNNQLRTKVINGRTVVEGKSVEPIKTLFAGDKSSETTTLNRLEYWYGEYLIAYGIQDIVNVSSAGDRTTRSVFFVNKLRCR